MKMRENLYNEDDPDLITKKLWSHIKSNSKSCRLPKTMHLNSTFRNKPSEKAELFNNYFYEQFSGQSDYNINIGWSNDQVFDIDLDQNKVRKLLLNINSNKASGPDGIHGKILKNCANTSISSFISLQNFVQHRQLTKRMEDCQCRGYPQKRKQGRYQKLSPFFTNQV